MTEREKLIDVLEAALPPYLLDLSGYGHVADDILAAGWRQLPTEGEEFDAAVERAGRKLHPRALTAWKRGKIAIALRAALNTGEPDA